MNSSQSEIQALFDDIFARQKSFITRLEAGQKDKISELEDTIIKLTSDLQVSKGLQTMVSELKSEIALQKNVIETQKYDLASFETLKRDLENLKKTQKDPNFEDNMGVITQLKVKLSNALKASEVDKATIADLKNDMALLRKIQSTGGKERVNHNTTIGNRNFSLMTKNLNEGLYVESFGRQFEFEGKYYEDRAVLCEYQNINLETKTKEEAIMNGVPFWRVLDGPFKGKLVQKMGPHSFVKSESGRTFVQWIIRKELEPSI